MLVHSIPTDPREIPCGSFLTGFFDFLGIGGSLSPSGDGLLADLFLGRPRSRRYPKFNIRRDIPALRIFKSRDRGDSWEALTNGLPQNDAYQLVLRAAMATDSLEPAGVYVGTQGGQVFGSRDEGDHWEALFPWLPPVYSVQTAVVEV